MSMTMSVGVVGPSHWSYMAKEFSRVIGDIIEQKRIDSDTVPTSLYADAKGFFELVSQFLQGGVPRNPPASANAYMIASRAIRTASSPSKSREDVKRSLDEYLKFFNKIQDARPLDSGELAIASSLQKFLDQLYQDGQSESYVARVKFKERMARN